MLLAIGAGPDVHWSLADPNLPVDLYYSESESPLTVTVRATNPFELELPTLLCLAVIELLIEYGADVDARVLWGAVEECPTALEVAIELQCDEDGVRALRAATVAGERAGPGGPLGAHRRGLAKSVFGIPARVRVPQL